MWAVFGLKALTQLKHSAGEQDSLANSCTSTARDEQGWEVLRFISL